MRAYMKSCASMRQVPVGVVMADTNRKENAQYYNCRTDPSDELENVEWYGLNVYIQCENISDPRLAAGMNNLVQDLTNLQYSVPLILTEFGCVSPAFPTVNGYEAQRTHHDAKFMNTAPYSKILGGGFVFEYNTEMANARSTSPYPFTKFGPQNYGLGYFSPADCNDVDIPCIFNEMPNFKFLADAYASRDTSSEPNFDSFTIEPARQKTSECPTAFPKLNAFTWAGDAAASIQCPSVTRLQCPNASPNKLATKLSTDAPSSSENSSMSQSSEVSDSESREGMGSSLENDLTGGPEQNIRSEEKSSDCGSLALCGGSNGKDEVVTETAKLQAGNANSVGGKSFTVTCAILVFTLWAI